jgi:hypothetical protein
VTIDARCGARFVRPPLETRSGVGSRGESEILSKRSSLANSDGEGTISQLDDLRRSRGRDGAAPGRGFLRSENRSWRSGEGRRCVIVEDNVIWGNEENRPTFWGKGQFIKKMVIVWMSNLKIALDL